MSYPCLGIFIYFISIHYCFSLCFILENVCSCKVEKQGKKDPKSFLKFYQVYLVTKDPTLHNAALKSSDTILRYAEKQTNKGD